MGSSFSTELKFRLTKSQSNHSPFKHSGFFVHRTPLLPIGEFLSSSGAQTQNSGGLDSFETSVLRAEEQLSVFSRRAEVLEALWISSPEFLEALAKHNECARLPPRIVRTLYKYFVRMTTRPTPFGLFAGCGLGLIGDSTFLDLAGVDAYRTLSRLDAGVLFDTTQKIADSSVYQEYLTFSANNTAYLAGTRFHYIREYWDGKIRSHRLVSVENSNYLSAVLGASKYGGKTFGDLEAVIKTAIPEISHEETHAYLRSLVQSRLLIADISPGISGGDLTNQLMRQLKTIPACDFLREEIGAINNKLTMIDAKGIGQRLEEYLRLSELVGTLSPESSRSRAIQVDMFKPSPKASLGESVVQEILGAVEFLYDWLPQNADDTLSAFRQEFERRYQLKEIALVEVLDAEIGIGFRQTSSANDYAEPLLQKVRLSRRQKSGEPALGGVEEFLLKKVGEALLRREMIVELTVNDLEKMKSERMYPLPNSFAATVALGRCPESPERISVHLRSVSGPSGMSLFGRFCHLDERLNTLVCAHLRVEEALEGGEVVFAEIVHCPEGRIGNVSSRPAFRHYEIPIFNRSTLPSDQQIPISDLTVSVRAGKVTLRSVRLDCEVIPRLTCAHNFYVEDKNIPIYRFLCCLQKQHVVSAMAWQWKSLSSMPFLPRVKVGQVVVSPARWLMSRELIEEFKAVEGHIRFQRVAEWRMSNRLPRFALLEEPDHEVLLDFESVLSVDMLVDLVRDRKGACLVEMLPLPDNLSVAGPTGKFAHEIIVPFIRSSTDRAKTSKSTSAGESARFCAKSETEDPVKLQFRAAERRFFPGSEWLFVKLYVAPPQVDRLLSVIVKPIVTEAVEGGIVDQWFFVRYGDPDWHLRLRFRGKPSQLLSEVLPILRQYCARHAKNFAFYRMELATYEREIERYGGTAAISVAEDCFHFDSQFVLALLENVSGDSGQQLRWLLALKTIDVWLETFGFDLVGRFGVIGKLRDAYYLEFRETVRGRRSIAQLFRERRAEIDSTVFAFEETTTMQPFRVVLSVWANQLKDIARGLDLLESKGELASSRVELVGSYIHMHLNRLLRSNHRAQELVLYDLLALTYRSKLAKVRRN
jgi:lantibiotic biosynthesis protein